MMISQVRKNAWWFTLLVGLGGLYFPKLGLLVLLVMLSLTLVSFFKGRYWCGNICPHGSLFDLFKPISRNQRIPAWLRSKTFAILFFIFFGFNITRRLIKVFASFGDISFWDKMGFVFVAIYLMVMTVGGLLSFFITPRTWCQFCPMGTMQVICYKLGKALRLNRNTDEMVTIAQLDKCSSCGICSRVCPMQLEPYLGFSDRGQFDHEDCIRCLACVDSCPRKLLTLATETIPLKQEKMDIYSS